MYAHTQRHAQAARPALPPRKPARAALREDLGVHVAAMHNAYLTSLGRPPSSGWVQQGLTDEEAAAHSGAAAGDGAASGAAMRLSDGAHREEAGASQVGWGERAQGASQLGAVACWKSRKAALCGRG